MLRRSERSLLLAALACWLSVQIDVAVGVGRQKAVADLMNKLQTDFTASLVVTSHPEGTCSVVFKEASEAPALDINWINIPGFDEPFITMKLRGCGNEKEWYLTRKKPVVQPYNKDTQFRKNDDRLWKITQCGLANQNAFYATLYYPDDTTATLLKVNNGELMTTTRKYSVEDGVSCTEGFFVYLFPNVQIMGDPCLPQILDEIRDAAFYTSRIGKREVPESLGRLLRLMIAVDNERYVVVRSRYGNGTFSDVLVIEPFTEEHLSADSLFYYSSGISTNRSGVLNGVRDEAPFTLLHALTRQFLTVDVDYQTSTLKAGGSLAGLRFQDASDFSESPIMDYRHFKAYRKEIDGGGHAVHVCSTQFRRFCFLPGRNGSLRMYPVEAGNSNLAPTLKDPTNAIFSAFSNVSRTLAGSVRPPIFTIFERRAVVEYGSPEIVYISVYTALPGNVQGLSVLSYDPVGNSIQLTTISHALHSPYRIIRRRYVEQGSAVIYISLQVATGLQAAPSTSGLYITRLSTKPVQLDSPIGSVDVDSRLFNTKCCFCSQDVLDVQWVYYNKGSNAVSLGIAQNGTLVLRDDALAPFSSCQLYALTMSTA